MFVKASVVIGALSALDAAFASTIARRQVLQDQNLNDRIPAGAKIGDECHQPGKYALGSDTLAPPCLSEQAVSKKCEIITGVTGPKATKEQKVAFRDCVTGSGSSYLQDIDACIKCKEINRHLSSEQADWFRRRYADAKKAFAAASEPDTLWTYVLRSVALSCPKTEKMGWGCFESLPKPINGQKENQERPASVDSYYEQRPAVQNVGEFTYEGKKYPEVNGSQSSTIELASPALCSFSSAVVQRNGSGEVAPNGLAEGPVVVSMCNKMEFFMKFLKKDEYSILSVAAGGKPIEGTSNHVNEDAAKQLPTCDDNCMAQETPITDLQGDNNGASQLEPARVQKIVEPALEQLEKDKEITPQLAKPIIAALESGPGAVGPSTGAVGAGSSGSKDKSSCKTPTGTSHDGAAVSTPFKPEGANDKPQDSAKKEKPKTTTSQGPAKDKPLGKPQNGTGAATDSPAGDEEKPAKDQALNVPQNDDPASAAVNEVLAESQCPGTLNGAAACFTDALHQTPVGSIKTPTMRVTLCDLDVNKEIVRCQEFDY